MKDKLFLCQIPPYFDYMKAFKDRNEAMHWWLSNKDSIGGRQVKIALWDRLPNAQGFEETELEQEKELDNVVELRSITGGKEPPQDGNFFNTMGVGTIFLVRSKQDLRDPNLHLFYLRGKTEKAVILSTPTVPQLMYQIPLIFCGKFDLYEIIGHHIDELEDYMAQKETKQEQETKENEDE